MTLALLLAFPVLAATPAVFGPPITVTPHEGWAGDLKTGDVNGDGLLDVSVSVGEDTSWKWADRPFGIELSLSNGAGGFDHVTVSAELYSGYSLVTDVADLDGDGLADLVAGHSDGVSIFFSDGSTLATQEDLGGPRVGAVELGDVDGDGDADLLTLDDDGELGVWHNDGDGGFTLVQSVPTGAGNVYDHEWDSIDLVDLDGDGSLDALVNLAEQSTDGLGPVLALLGDGTGQLDAGSPYPWADPTYGWGVYDLDVGDIDSDGRVDMVYAGLHANVNSVPWDGGFGALVSWPMDSYAYNWVLTGDVDGDGDLDVIGTVGFGVGVLLQESGALVDSGVDYAMAETSGWAVANDAIELVDINGDGCADVVAHLYDLGTTILPATGAGCDGATPSAWSGATEPDPEPEDTGTIDPGEGDTGDGEAEAPVDDEDREEPPSAGCSAVGVGASLPGLLALSLLGLRRRR